MTKISEAVLMDNMEYMAKFPDKYFQLACVDPPYGIGDKFKGGATGKMNFNEIVNKGWDKAPTDEYFKELFRVSENQIIWGGNYFNLPPSRCFIIWDKLISDDFSLAMCEMAWTSFDKIAKIFKYSNPKNSKIHPTQKPVKLYKWLLQNYAKPNDKILDTHLGSQSSRIAAYEMDFDFYGCEIDKDYFNDGCKRFDNAIKQQSLFTFKEQTEIKQLKLI
jgi:site-specific DNA-methyltransferase (adenine-specific)